MSAVPLIVLLFMLFTGCVYYLWLYRIYLKNLVKVLVETKKDPTGLKEKSLEELLELLLLSQSLERYERCAEIRDEINSRVDINRVTSKTASGSEDIRYIVPDLEFEAKH